MNALPDPTQPTAAPAGQAPAPSLTDSVIEAAVRDAIRQTHYRDDSPLPAVGSALPVPQPGRPPMSQKATDASALMLSAGVASLPIGGMTSLVIYTLGHADPVSLTIGAAAPAILALPILALSSLIKRTKQAAPDVHHHHYNGNVIQDHRQVNTTTKGVWARTRNELTD
ncbi:hypothetical protein ACWHA6_37735 [Streptomyces anthocyanicus]|uniref:hypothetical protein n=1 Tax=Streptomyces TaxID=1883 RepID=UPI0036645ED5